MATTFMDKQKNALIKKYHTLLRKGNVSDTDKKAILAQWGVTTSVDLTLKQLIEVCDLLDRTTNPESDELDKRRKRLIAVIFAWREAMGCVTDMNEVKGIACNASGKVCSFNDIPKEQLQSLYYAFRNQTKDLNNVAVMTEELVGKMITLN